MHAFLVQLHETGQVAVGPFGPEHAAGEPSDAFAILRRMDQDARLDFPGDAPAFAWPAAHWGAETFYRACQLLVCREVSAADTLAALSDPCPQPLSPETHYSVDLVLRYLPDLLGTARRLAAGDVLVEALRRLTLAWPLSSVGVPGMDPGDLRGLDSLLGHRGLRLLYVDRVLRHRDRSRLGDARVRAAVGSALGPHADTLLPEAAAFLTPGPVPALLPS